MRNHNRRFSGPRANAVLDTLQVALILVDADGLIVAANPEASEYLLSGEGLRECEGRLVAETAADVRRLQRELGAAAREGCRRAVLLNRSVGATPLAVALLPYEDPEDGPAKALVVIHDPGRKVDALTASVRSMFRLSPAEADIAVRLALGADLDQIACSRGVSVNTLRAQLAAAMGKAGVRRQAELVSAIFRVCAV